MKVKVMRFRVSNAASAPSCNDYKEQWYRDRKAELVSEAEIEAKVNAFISNVKVVDIKVSTVEVHYHNNARGNTVDLVYTIMYEE